jgi:hypothetical protein
VIGLPDVTQRKKKRNTSGDANSQANASDPESVHNDFRSDPMPSAHKSNGHAPESTTRQDISTFENWAASDDARGHLVAETAASAAAACANRDAYAEMAPADAKGKRLPPAGAASRPHNATETDAKATDKKKVAPDIPPGAEPLPADGASFVEAVHEKVDLIELEVSLLTSAPPDCGSLPAPRPTSRHAGTTLAMAARAARRRRARRMASRPGRRTRLAATAHRKKVRQAHHAPGLGARRHLGTVLQKTRRNEVTK